MTTDLAPSGRFADLIQRPGPAPLLATCDYDDCPDLEAWVLYVRERLWEDDVLAIYSHVEQFERQGELFRAIQGARRLIELDPLSEDAHVRLMRLYAATGQRHRAVRVFEQLRARLRLDLDVEPLPHTQRALEAVLARVPSSIEPAWWGATLPA